MPVSIFFIGDSDCSGCVLAQQLLASLIISSFLLQHEAGLSLLALCSLFTFFGERSVATKKPVKIAENIAAIGR